MMWRPRPSNSADTLHRGGVGTLERDTPGPGRRRAPLPRTIPAVFRAVSVRGAGEPPWTTRRLARHAGTSASTVSRIRRRYSVTADLEPAAPTARSRETSF